MSLHYLLVRKLTGALLPLASLLFFAGQLSGNPAPAATDTPQFQNAHVSTQASRALAFFEKILAQ